MGAFCFWELVAIAPWQIRYLNGGILRRTTECVSRVQTDLLMREHIGSILIHAMTINYDMYDIFIFM